MTQLRPNPDALRTQPYSVPPSILPDPATALRLDANEDPTPASPAAMAAAAEALRQAYRYPDPTAAGLRAAIAEAEGLPADQIVCGHGSEELIQLLLRGYLQRGDEIVLPQTIFSVFRIAGSLAGATVVAAPERDLHLDVDALLARVTERTRIVAVANPNNPTGVCAPWEEIVRLHRGLPEDVLLILDAAYAEYVGDPTYRPGHELVRPEGNVAVLRTFSKAHALAGLRVGWAHAPPDVCETFRRVKPFFNVTATAADAAAASVRDRERLQRVREAAAASAAFYEDLWRELGLRSIQGATNFTYVQAPGLFEHLASHNIKAIGLSGYGLPDSVRITFGTPEQNARVAEAARAWARG